MYTNRYRVLRCFDRIASKLEAAWDSNLRGIIGYNNQDNVNSLLEKHVSRKDKTYERLAAIEKTMVTPEGHAAYKKIQEALEAYFKIETEIIELGSTIDADKREMAQNMAFSDLAPAYEELDAVTLAKPLGELEERLVDFEKGDISSPFPDYYDADEVGDMVTTVSKTTKKLQLIFEDLEYLLNEMADGNFNLKTACEEGGKIVLKTAEVLESVVTSVKDIADTSKELSASIKIQAESIGQAEEGITRISEVVQSNSTTAEETSATSEELSAQATCMDELVAKFQLRD